MRLPFRAHPADSARDGETPYRPRRSSVDEARSRLTAATQGGVAAEIARAGCDLGLALFDAGDESGARAAFEHVVGLGDPAQTPRALRNLAMTGSGRTDTESARELLRRAIAFAHPVWSREAALSLSESYVKAGDVAGALAVLAPTAALPVADAHGLADLLQGRMSALQGDPAGARSSFQAVLARPDDEATGRAAMQLAQLHEREGDSRSAEPALRRALRVLRLEQDDHQMAHARVGLGWVFLQRNDVAAARAEFETAIASGCANARAAAHLHLGRIHLREADETPAPRRRRSAAERAVTELRQALESDDPEVLRNARTSLDRAAVLVDDGRR